MTQRLKILLVNNVDDQGGAARVVQLLRDGLEAKGHTVSLLVRDINDSGSGAIKLSHNRLGLSSGIRRRVVQRLGIPALGIGAEFPKRQSSVRFQDFDVIHLHDPPGLDWLHLPWLCRRLPVVWTMHTMQPFTGNCLYSYGCDRFGQSCGDCPQIGKFPLMWLSRDSSKFIIRVKRMVTRLVQPDRLRIVGVSDWISNLANRGIFGRFPIRTIQNAVDPSRFRAINRVDAREHLGVPQDAEVIAFSVAGRVADRRKGLDIVMAALPRLQRSKYFFLPMSIGEVSKDVENLIHSSGFQCLPAKHLDSDYALNCYYSAADVIWHPSRADTSSMVSLEAFACGTTVIAAAVGGVPEVVGDLGVLIPPEDPDRLATVTDQFFRDQHQHRPVRLPAEFTTDRMVSEYETEYRSVQAC